MKVTLVGVEKERKKNTKGNHVSRGPNILDGFTKNKGEIELQY